MNKSKYCIILLNIVSILIFCGLVDLFIHNISDNNKREIFYCDILKLEHLYYTVFDFQHHFEEDAIKRKTGRRQPPRPLKST